MNIQDSINAINNSEFSTSEFIEQHFKVTGKKLSPNAAIEILETYCCPSTLGTKCFWYKQRPTATFCRSFIGQHR